MTDPALFKHLHRWDNPRDIRFITFTCERRLPLMGNPAIRDVFVDSLNETRRKHGVKVFAAGVMPEHAHLLLQPGRVTRLSDALRSLKMSVAKRVLLRWRELDAPVLKSLERKRIHRRAGETVQTEVRFWQKGGGFDRNVRDLREFAHTVWYIHNNPVVAKLVPDASDWRWSTVCSWMGVKGVGIEADEPPGGAEVWGGWTGYK